MSKFSGSINERPTLPQSRQNDDKHTRHWHLRHTDDKLLSNTTPHDARYRNSTTQTVMSVRMYRQRHLRCLCAIHRHVGQVAAVHLVLKLVTTRLDYCNAICRIIRVPCIDNRAASSRPKRCSEIRFQSRSSRPRDPCTPIAPPTGRQSGVASHTSHRNDVTGL
jgi:hypothetical protein